MKELFTVLVFASGLMFGMGGMHSCDVAHADVTSTTIAASVPVVVQPTIPVVIQAPASTTLTPQAAQVSAAVDKIPLTLPSWFFVLLAFVVDLIMRAWPSVKPRSIFILIGQVFGLIGDGFKKISSLLDLIVQNLKDPDTK